MTVARDGGAKTLWKRDGGKEMVGKKSLQYRRVRI